MEIEWYNADMLHHNGQFLNLQQFQQKLGIQYNNFTEFYGVLAAIPKHWKDLLKEKKPGMHIVEATDDVTILLGNIKLNLETANNKQLYTHFLKKFKETPTAVAKWSELYNIEEGDWVEIFRNAFKVCRETKLQSLQYKILHRIFPCNVYVSRWNSTVSEHCPHCQMADTLEHYFYHCESIRFFWSAFTRWWCCITGINLTLSEVDIIFGGANENNDELCNALNFCILFGKSYIVRCRYRDHKCSLIEFLRLLKDRLEIEAYICKINNQQALFENRFGIIVENS